MRRHRSAEIGGDLEFHVLGRPGPLRDAKWELYSQWVMTYAYFNSSTHLGVLRIEP